MSVSETKEGRGGKGPVRRCHRDALAEASCFIVPLVLIVATIGLVAVVWDKRQAGRRRRRVRERTLLVLAVGGGAWGVWAGMLLVRHKTRKTRFRFGVPPLALLWLAVAFWATADCLHIA